MASAGIRFDHVATLRGLKDPFLPHTIGFLPPYASGGAVEEGQDDDRGGEDSDGNHVVPALPRILTLASPGRRGDGLGDFGGLVLGGGLAPVGGEKGVLRRWTPMTPAECAAKRSFFRDPIRFKSEICQPNANAAPAAFDPEFMAIPDCYSNGGGGNNSGDVDSVILGHADGAVTLTDVGEEFGRERYRREGGGRSIRALGAVSSSSAFSTTAELCVVSCETTGVQLLDFRQPPAAAPARDFPGVHLESVDVSPEGDTAVGVVRGNAGRYVIVVDLDSGETVAELGHGPLEQETKGHNRYDPFGAAYEHALFEFQAASWLRDGSGGVLATGSAGSYLWQPFESVGGEGGNSSDAGAVLHPKREDLWEDAGGVRATVAPSGEFAVVGDRIFDPISRTPLGRLPELDWDDDNRSGFIGSPSNVAISQTHGLVAASTDSRRASVCVFRRSGSSMTKAASKR